MQIDVQYRTTRIVEIEEKKSGIGIPYQIVVISTAVEVQQKNLGLTWYSGMATYYRMESNNNNKYN